MHFLFISIFFFMSFISCKAHRVNRDNKQSVRKQYSQKVQNKKLNSNQPVINSLKVVKNEVNVEILHKVSLLQIIKNKRYSHRKVQAVCRGIEGCLQICEYFNHTKCKRFSVNNVVSFWLNQIDSYTSWEQSHRDLNFIASIANVSSFLKIVDKKNRVVKSLFQLSTLAQCPFNQNKKLYFSYSPLVTLFLGPPTSKEKPTESMTVVESTDVVDMTVEKLILSKKNDMDHQVKLLSLKKIMDNSVMNFNLPIFMGYISQCFGYNTKTFSEMALQTKNKDAFDIGHQVISKACDKNNECIRLAYCSIDSPLVNQSLTKETTDLGCTYDSFSEILP